MSVTFSASNLSLDIEEELNYNFSNVNAAELLQHLGIENYEDYGLCGSILSRHLRRRIESFLEKEEPARREMQVKGRVIECGDTRDMHNRAEKLLELCEKAGDLAFIIWS